MSMFSRMDAVAAPVMTAVHGDEYQLTPMVHQKDKNAPVVADASRPAMTITGIYREREAPKNIPNAYDRRTDQRPGVESSIPTIEVDPRVQAAGFVDVRPSDLLTGPDGKIWRVSKLNTDEMGRIHAAVNLAGT